MSQLFKHYEVGEIYEVVDDNVRNCSSLRQKDVGIVSVRMVLYRRQGDKQLYVRTFDEFHSKAPNGEQRFTPCD